MHEIHTYNSNFQKILGFLNIPSVGWHQFPDTVHNNAFSVTYNFIVNV